MGGIHTESRSNVLPVKPSLLCCAFTPCFNTSEIQHFTKTNKIFFFLYVCKPSNNINANIEI